MSSIHIGSIPLFTPGTIYMEIVSDSVVVEGIPGKFQTLGTNLSKKNDMRKQNL